VQEVTQEVPTVFANGEHVRKMDTTRCGGVSGKGDRADDMNTNMVQN
jgi:hypothetical protein